MVDLYRCEVDRSGECVGRGSGAAGHKKPRSGAGFLGRRISGVNYVYCDLDESWFLWLDSERRVSTVFSLNSLEWTE